MPELPDIELYCEALMRDYGGMTIERVELRSPFLVRTAQPDLFAVEGRRVIRFYRLGKRIVWQFEGHLFLVLHLMIAGRMRQRKRGARLRGKQDLAAFHFEGADDESAVLVITEASTKKRASVHMVDDANDVDSHDPGGLETLQCSFEEFCDRLCAENHTLKRSLTSPQILSGIGNAYSDEILHAARLSPIQWTSRLNKEELRRLFTATRQILADWTERLRVQSGGRFPNKITAFRPEMAVHGKFGEPCPDCATEIQRIRYADTEVNYCPRCQTGGKMLADRSLSRLLKQDWPRSIDEWEAQR